MTCIDCNKRPARARQRCSSCYHKAIRRGIIEARSQIQRGAKRCSVQGCISSPPYRRGLCDMHYMRWKRYGSADERWPARCVTAGCERGTPLRRGMCNLHYQRWAREQKKIGV